MFEPVHGSAPDIAGQGISNPIGAISSAALMLDQFGLTAQADRVRQAIENVTGAGILPRDLGGESNTVEMTEAIVAQLEAIHAEEPAAV